MATLSTHILDSLIGDHARQIRVVCLRPDSSDKTPVFDAIADDNGRISEIVDVAEGGEEIELQFHAADYFAQAGHGVSARNPLTTVIVRMTLADPAAQYHIPLVLSPHAYTVWWSGLPERQPE